MDQNCKSHSCDDPEHEHQFPDMKEMKKNLDKQLEKCSDGQMFGDKPGIEKALTASSVAGLAREARFAVRSSGASRREIRHLGEMVPSTVHVTPISDYRESPSYSSCGGCGIVHKSMQPCPRCTVADSMVEATDWRTR